MLDQVKVNLQALLFILLFVFLLDASLAAASEAKKEQLINCDIQQNACTQSLSDIKVTLDIQPKPVKAMKDLSFKVTLLGALPEANPYIDLGMPGMDMGPNRVLLKSSGEGTYEGTGVIVKCPSGRKTWRARVTMPGKGSVDFIFDVLY